MARSAAQRYLSNIDATKSGRKATSEYFRLVRQGRADEAAEKIRRYGERKYSQNTYMGKNAG